MIFSKKIRLIKTIQQKNFRNESFSDEDISFLLSCVTHEHSDGVYTASLIALTESSNAILDVLIKEFHALQDQAQMLAIPMLACTDYVKCYYFLLERLKSSDSMDEVAMISMVLSSTHYLIVPLLVHELISDNKQYLNRLAYILKDIGFKRVMSYLILHPQIPFESFFRDLFGDDKIEAIKQKN
ncbi:hypothetical protein CL658_05115 [bacterium]|nr:hypothetical protein [bacterium]|tara:strand:+ start:214 stop:765 length:552 start_codon:yes stop_codon:yes gene_type:complete